MAQSLLDVVQQNAQKIATQPAQDTNQTGQAASLLSAKTGKATTSATGGYAQSNLGETSANDATNAIMKNQVAPASNLQMQGLQQQSAAVTQQTQQGLSTVASQSKANTLQTQVQTTAMLNDMAQQKGQIDMERNRAQVDQVATNLRLSNQQYVDNLQLEGSKARLNNQMTFQQTLAETIFGDKLGVLNQQLGDKSVLDVNNQEFERAMGQMSVDQASTIMGMEISQQNQQAQWGYIGAGTTGAIAAGSKASSNSSSSSSASNSADTNPAAQPGGSQAATPEDTDFSGGVGLPGGN